MTRSAKKLLIVPVVFAIGLAVTLFCFWTVRANAFGRVINVDLPMATGKPAWQMLPTRPTSVVQSPRPTESATAVFVNASPKKVEPVDAAPMIGHAGILNRHRQFALGMIETANDDREIGLLGEVSRYQIMPSVWRHYSNSQRYHDPEVSLEVARQHWSALYDLFKKKANREPTDFDMYVLWNTRYGYYASKGFRPERLNSTVRDRAERFTNLVERGDT